MTILTAICDRCGHLTRFNSPFGPVAHSSFVNSSAGSCPRCGGNLSIPNTYTDDRGHAHFFRDAYNILTRPGVTDRDRVILREIIERAHSQNLSVDEVEADIKHEVPNLSDFARIIRWSANSDTAKALANWAQVLSLIVAVYVYINSKSAPSSDELVDAFIKARDKIELVHKNDSDTTEHSAQNTGKINQESKDVNIGVLGCKLKPSSDFKEKKKSKQQMAKNSRKRNRRK